MAQPEQDVLIGQTQQKQGYSISCVMIVKDEGETLAAAIESVLPFIDELVIGVDDSCTDNTPQIAQQYASTYFTFTWNDNFSEARNRAIEKATGDIIFILDGHEFVPPDNHPVLLQLARMRGHNVAETHILTSLSFFENIKRNGIPQNPKLGKPFDVVCITLAMNVDAFGVPALFFLQPRLFWNNGTIKYTAAVHNYLEGYNKENALGWPEGVLVHNMPPKREEMRKGQRKTMNVEGLWEDIKRNPEDGRPYFYIGNTYADRGEAKKALLWYKRYLKYSKFGQERYQVCQQLAVLYHRNFKKPEKALPYALEAMSLDCWRAEPYIIMGEMAYEKGDFHQALHWFHIVERMKAPDTVMFMQGAVYSYMPLMKLMSTYERLEDWEEALHYCQLSLDWRPGDEKLKAMVGKYKKAIQLRDKAHTNNGKTNLLFVDEFGSFSQDIAQRLLGIYDIRYKKAVEPADKGWADIAFVDWCSQQIIQATREPWHIPLVCRLHSYEVYNGHPAQVNWEPVSALVFVADHIKRLALANWPDLAQKTRLAVIPNGVDVDAWTFKERDHGRRIGYVGYLNHKKGIWGLAQAAMALPDYEFHIAGQEQDAHLAHYMSKIFQHQHNVYVHGWVPKSALDGWMEYYIDYLISPSIVESFGYSIAEAMCKGIKPLVHDREGALWGETWRTIDDLRALLEQPVESERYRQHIIDHFHIDKVVRMFHQLFADMLIEG